MTLNLSQTDAITRLRRWAGLVGKASPNASDTVTLVAQLANLAQDPYQSEYQSYSVSFTSTIAAANLTFAGLQNGSSGPFRGVPLLIVDRIDIQTATAQAASIILQRPSSNSAIAALGQLSYQRGWPQGNISNAPGAQTIQNNAPGGLSGSTLATYLSVAVGQVVTWQPPQPVLLYPQQVAAAQGDAIYVQAGTVDTNIQATFYWREYSPFKY